MKKALVVSIDDYPGSGNDLESCINDGNDFASLLRSRFEFDEVEQLQNKYATVDAVKRKLLWLLEGARRSDRLVFFFSGHGSQQNVNGTLEEYLKLHNGNMKDDELVRLSRTIPSGALSVVLDCCFSGGLGKDSLRPFEVIGGQAVRSKFFYDTTEIKSSALDSRVRSIRPFGFTAQKFDSPVSLDEAKKRLKSEQGQQTLNGLLFSASGENEPAMSNTESTDGRSAFTYCLLKALGSDDDVSNRELLRRTTQELRDHDFEQTPTLVEPSEPAGLGGSSFVTLRNLSVQTGSHGDVGPANDVVIASVKPNMERLSLAGLSQLTSALSDVLEQDLRCEVEAKWGSDGCIDFIERLDRS